MRLTSKKAENLKYNKGKDRFLDGDGLYLRISAMGHKSFQRKDTNKVSKKVTWITLGSFKSDLTLAEARDMNSAVKRLIEKRHSKENIRNALTRTKDPVELNQIILGFSQSNDDEIEGMTFSQMHKVWHDYKKPSWKNKVQIHQAWRNIEHYVYPYIGDIQMSNITTMHIVNALEPIWAAKPATARRIKQWISKIFEMALSPAYGLVTSNPASFDTEFLLPNVPPSQKHQPSVHYENIPNLWKAITNLAGTSKLGKAATLIVLLTAKRAGEVVNMRWQDLDLDKAEWNVFDGARTKTGMPHRCPLPSEAVKILKELQTITGDKDNVFHRDNVNGRIALDVPRKNLQSAWGSKDVSAHGTRHSLKTWAMEVGYRKELSEMQLSHEEQGIEAVYNDADYLRDRKIMMQHWQDYLTGTVSLEERNRV